MASEELPVVIDVFRAFTTACHVLSAGPAAYLMVATSEAALVLRRSHPGALMIGKPEVGEDCLYDIPNSPLLATRADIRGRVVIHRTAAGAPGLINLAAEGPALAACFANLAATVRTIRSSGRRCWLSPMGHEGKEPSLEDDLCAEAIMLALDGRRLDLTPHLPSLRMGSGRYFFGADQAQYPQEDFALCLSLDVFDFPIWARRHGDYVMLGVD